MESSLSSTAGRADEPSKKRRARGSGTPFSFLDRERIDWWCEKSILGTVLAILVFGPFAFGATRPKEMLVLFGLGALMMVFWAVRLCVRTQYRFFLAPFCWAVLAFTGYTIWWYTRADVEYLARFEMMQVILYAAVFFAVLDNLSSQENLQIILFTLIFAAMVNAFYAIFQFFTDSQFVLWYPKMGYRGRASGTYICPNHLSGYLEMILPIAVAYTVAGRMKPLTKVFLGYAALAMVAGIGVTISRGGYVSIAIALGAMFLSLLWNRDFRLPALGLLIVLLGVGTFFGYRSINAQLRFQELQAANTRPYFWKPAIQMWKTEPWFGVGPNHYDYRFREYRHWLTQKRPVYAHSDYLNTLADYGVVGAGIVGAGLVLLGWGVFRTWKYVRRTNEIATKPSNRSAVVLGCAAGLLAIVAHSAVDFNMHIPANALVAVVLMAILTVHIRFATERFWVNPGWIGRTIGVLLLLAVGACLSFQTVRLGREEFYLNQAAKAKQDSEEWFTALKRAHAIEPMNFETPLRIGEAIRREGWNGDEGYQDKLRESLIWFGKAIELNKLEPANHIQAGMAHHWLDDPEKASEHFENAFKLDPESTYVRGYYGWHRLQLGDLEGAKTHLQAGFWYDRANNKMAKNYLDLVERLLAEKNQIQ